MSKIGYPRYRASGIDWLGAIPDHWAVAPLKRIVAVPITDGPHETPDFVAEGIPFVSAEAVSGGTVNFSKLRGFISEHDHRRYSQKYLPQRGDIFIVKSGATTGLSAIVETDREFNIWSPLAAVRCGPDIHSKFLLYYVRSRNFLEAVTLFWSFGTQQNLGMGVLENLQVALPPLAEQTAIAAFLERETAKIDALVGEQKRLIDLLKEKRQAVISHAVTKGLNPDAPMKDTGIEWLGEVPEHWDLYALNRLTDPRRPITYGIVQPGSADPNGRFMIRGQDYSRGWVEAEEVFRVSPAVEEPYRRARLLEDDIVITIVGAGTGNTAVVPGRFHGANLTQTTARISPNKALLSAEFLHLVLTSRVGRTQVALFQKGAAQPGLNLEHLKAFRIPLPPPSEQLQLTAKLSAELDASGQLEAEAVRVTALLKERRAALISAAVTGKIDVRGLMEVEDAA